MVENRTTAAKVAARYRGALTRAAFQMDAAKLVKVFDSLKSKQRVKAAIRSIMGHGDSENGEPTEYLVGRRGKGRRGETVSLLPADGRKPHALSKVTLVKYKSRDGEDIVVAALGDMAATLMSLEVV